MRYLGMSELLTIIGTRLSAPPDLLLGKMIDPDLAIAALMRGGGPPFGSRYKAALQRGAETFRAFVELKPSTVGSDDDIAYAAAQAIAGKFGYQLELQQPDALAQAIRTDLLSQDDLLRAIRSGLCPVAGWTAQRERGMEGLCGAFSFAVSTPTEELEPVTKALYAIMRNSLERTGCAIDGPEPCGHVDRRGRRDNRATRGGTARTTDELFEISLARVVSGDFIVCFDDPRGGGSIVERQWAKQLSTPVFQLRMHDAIRPHDDGDGWNISLDYHPGDLVAETANTLVATIHRWSWRIRDYAALRDAIEIKNAQEVSYLRGEWGALGPAHRLQVVKRATVAQERINAYLESGVAWELASERERAMIRVNLLEPPLPRGAFYELRDYELALIAEAGAELNLPAYTTLKAASLIARRMALPRTRFDLANVAQAKIAVRIVLDL